MCERVSEHERVSECECLSLSESVSAGECECVFE